MPDTTKKHFTELEIPLLDAERYLAQGNKTKLELFFYKNEQYQQIFEQDKYFIVGDKGSGGHVQNP